MRDAMERQAEEAGGQWAVVNNTWEGAKHYRTAKDARRALHEAGYKGPYGKGTSSRWSK